MNQTVKANTLIKVLISITVISSLFGQLCKLMHWPGAGISMMLGTFVLCFLYIPLYFIEAKKGLETIKSKLILLAQSLVIFLFGLGFLFKIMHWPGSGLLYDLNYSILFFVVTPYSIYHLIKSYKKSIFTSHAVFLAIYFFAFSMSSLFMSGAGKINVNPIYVQGNNMENALQSAKARNINLYRTIKDAGISDTLLISIKSKKLKELCDTTSMYIQDLKSELLSQSAKISKAIADTILFVDIKNPNELEIPNLILFETGDSKTYKYSAFRLKKVINNFRDSLISLVSEEKRTVISEGINLSTENYESADGEIIPWEVENFSHTPLLSAIYTLLSIQYEIKNAEYQILIDILNSEKQNLSSGVQNKITELNSNYTENKKQEEISKLQSENEKREEMISQREEELNAQKQTILVFVLITLLFLIMVFFVVRSNYLRKQANKTLLSQKIIIEKQKEEAEQQKHVIEEKQKEIIDSISYAKRLQEAILPPAKFINENLPNNFVIYLPKDIVAGDFYWAEKINDLFYIAAADSTGHGVPGAMVSVVCSNALNRTVKEFNITDTGKILDKTRELVLETFSKSNSDVKDGMDISLICIDKAQKLIYWSGANNPLWYLSNNELKEIKADKQPVGKSDHAKPFTSHQLAYNSGDIFYLFTDGLADQFGGPKGKKFKYKQFEELLVSIKNKTMTEQAQDISHVFMNWKGGLEQVDDVCVIGIKL